MWVKTNVENYLGWQNWLPVLNNLAKERTVTCVCINKFADTCYFKFTKKKKKKKKINKKNKTDIPIELSVGNASEYMHV